jgi:MEMO1 family protein
MSKNHDDDGARIRPSAVASRFYPSNPPRLAGIVQDFLRAVPDVTPAEGLKAIIAPHAGYVYSGPVAATAYAVLGQAAGRLRRVVLIGPSHVVWVPGLAVPTAGAFATPLGMVPVDWAAVRSILNLPQVVDDDAPHRGEHGLEIHLPFLQLVLGAFAVVPLVVGKATPGAVTRR